MARREELDRGIQIVYVPEHAGGRLCHPDVEYGFVTSVTDNYAFCRFWRKDKGVLTDDLRTKANSEAVKFENIVIHQYANQGAIEWALRTWCS